jgi:hypothetical protein
MGWKRNIIVNVQPKDNGIKEAVEYLRNKPVQEQGQHRLTIDFDRLSELEFGAEDKVYLVGHGGGGKAAGTLGGMNPVTVAAHVATSMKNVGQINLVMCGGGDPTLSASKTFKNTIDEYGCGATVYAYTADLKVTKDGKKYALDFEGSPAVSAIAAKEVVPNTEK